jgi:hypothetical protein
MTTFPFNQISVDRRGDVFCVHLKHPKMHEVQLHQLGEELNQLVTENGCKLMALSLGNDQFDCLYSSFIGKLMTVRRMLLEKGGHVKLCDVGPASLSVLQTCKLTDLFDIHPDVDSTVQALLAAG